MANLKQLLSHGQSIWYDYIHRDMIVSGEIKKLIKNGVRGMTSNPAIFKNAIAGSETYDAAIKELVIAGKSTQEIYDALVIQDIRDACDALDSVYKKSKGEDGFVSLEVSPTLAHDTNGTIADAKRYYAAVDRENVMIKVPAAAEGLPAVTELIASGINVNITLIFANPNYRDVVNAFLDGLEKLDAAGGDISKIASVASYFVSRTDGVVDKLLTEKGNTTLLGKIAVANAKEAYSIYKELFAGARWEKLAAKGARPQRLLWASTGVKNPDYSDVMYVDELIGNGTVNTVPPTTLKAFLDHGTVADKVEQNLETTQKQLQDLAAMNIDIAEITSKLQTDGIAQFVQAFEELMRSIEQKKKDFSSDLNPNFASLGSHELTIADVFAEMKENHILARLWAKDHTVWKSDPTEITNRLDWLDSPWEMQNNLPEINSFVEEVRQAGFTNVLLFGMGGSSMAPEVFHKIFGVKKGYLDLAVLDSTDPGAVLAREAEIDLEKTLFIVSTKSGSTVETLSFFKYFYQKVHAVSGNKAGQQFVAITDGGSSLEDMAGRYSFRRTFLNNPHIGGRFSALSYFGLVPAALIGIDVENLLDKTISMAEQCRSREDNSGVWLGVVMGELARAGRDKVTLITTETLQPIGAWIEQLVAESSGKEYNGILPVTTETIGELAVYSNDRLFIYLKLSSDKSVDAEVNALIEAGHPVVQFNLKNIDELGAEFFRWEVATAIACRSLGVNPFDQPNVEAAKDSAKKIVAEYLEKGELPDPAPVFEEDGIAVFADSGAVTLKELLQEFFSHAQKTPKQSYVAVHAYVTPTNEMDSLLKVFASTIRDSQKLATTIGYGPRFLHSTGQLHKGDEGHGLFIQLTSSARHDAAIPDDVGSDTASMSFQVLKTAQAMGDRQALSANGRYVITLNLGENPIDKLKNLIDQI
ncbi:MAG: bifunctional transaldolase/phosoglucose isomerase [Calditrichaeota bacterium]|nr:MAG: bifunctional transaldolase/phosoglucose isomerase [Calditrichota bacterium]